MMRRVAIGTICVLFAIFAGASCQLPTQASGVKYGSIRLRVASIEGSRASGRTILPSNCTIASYSLSGTGPSGATTSASSSSGSFDVSSLLVGSWSLTVTGNKYTWGSPVLTGSTKVTIAEDQEASATISLTPASGTGTLNLSATWPEAESVSVVTATVTASGATAKTLSFTVSGSSASYSGSLDAGSYVLILRFTNSSGLALAAPRMESLVVYQGVISSSSYALTLTDFATVATTGVSLDTTSKTIYKDDTYQLAATVAPSTATTKDIVWSSSATGVATVSSAGLVTGVDGGTAVITATTLDGGHTATSSVEVLVHPSYVSLSTGSVSMASYETFPLMATVYPTNATNQKVSWISSTPSIATVDTSGLVTAVSPGSTTITVLTEDGSYTSTCAVTVDSFQFKRKLSAGKNYWTSVVASEDGNFLAASSDSGIYSSSDRGATWTAQSATTSLGFSGLAMSKSVGLMAACGSSYIYTSKDKGASWTKCGFAGQHSWTELAVSSDGGLIAAAQNGGYILTSSDAGSSWTARTAAGSGNWACIGLSANGSVVLAGISYGNLYKSTDSGATWNEISSPGNQWWRSIDMSADGSIMYASCYNSSSVYRSIDSGATWDSFTTVYNPMIHLSTSGNSLLITSLYSDSFWQYSSDAGSTFTAFGRSVYARDAALSKDGSLAIYTDGSYLYTWDIDVVAAGSLTASD